MFTEHTYGETYYLPALAAHRKGNCEGGHECPWRGQATKSVPEWGAPKGTRKVGVTGSAGVRGPSPWKGRLDKTIGVWAGKTLCVTTGNWDKTIRGLSIDHDVMTLAFSRNHSHSTVDTPDSWKAAEKISLRVTLVAQQREMRWVLRDRMMRIRDGAGRKWLRLSASNAGGMGSTPGRGAKIPHATQCSQKWERERERDGADSSEIQEVESRGVAERRAGRRWKDLWLHLSFQWWHYWLGWRKGERAVFVCLFLEKV